MLKNQGVKFDESDHYIFFSRMTTLDVTAERLAKEIGMKFDRDTKSINKANFSEFLGGSALGGGSVIAAWNRYRSDPDHTALKLGTDISKELSSTLGGAKAIRTTAIATGAALGVIGAAGGAATGLPASITFATAVFGAMAGVGPGLVKAWLPHYYDKIKAKL